MYMFQDGKLKQKIELTGIDTARKVAKGTVYDSGSQGTQSWTSSITFDAGFTVDKKMVVSAQQKFGDSSNSGSFARQADMTIFTENTDVSSIKLASKGTWGGQAFKDRGFAKFDGTYGSTVMESEGTNAGQTFSFARINFFDKDGYVAASNASTNFASGGTLYLGKSDLPSYLADTFSITAATGWDGSFDETVDLDPDSATHKLCEKKQKHQSRDCWGSDFGNGETAK